MSNGPPHERTTRYDEVPRWARAERRALSSAAAIATAVTAGALDERGRRVAIDTAAAEIVARIDHVTPPLTEEERSRLLALPRPVTFPPGWEVEVTEAVECLIADGQELEVVGTKSRVASATGRRSCASPRGRRRSSPASCRCS